MSPSYSVTPKTIEEFAIVVSNVQEDVDEIKKDMKEIKNCQNEFRELLNKAEKKLWGVLVILVTAIGARYGIDLSGIAG